MPEWQAGGLVEDYGHYNRGEAAILSTAEEVTGIKPRNFHLFAQDYKRALLT